MLLPQKFVAPGTTIRAQTAESRPAPASTAAATSAGLAGLLNGVTPTTITGAPGGAPGDIVRDLGVLAAAFTSSMRLGRSESGRGR